MARAFHGCRSGTFGVMELHVGCAMWTYAPWQGRYLPGSLSPRDRLRAYATWCNAVEGNTTFYATPTLDTVKSWAGQTTPDFRFILKLPKPITHERRLVDVDDPLRAFLTAIEPLGQRAHALWIQLPPSFSPAGLGALTGFLRRLPHEYRYCVEVRHRACSSWSKATTRTTTRAYGLPAVCVQTCGSLVCNRPEPVHTQWKFWGFRCLAATMTGVFTWESASRILCMQRKLELSTCHAAVDN